MSFEHEVGYKPTCAGSPCKAKPALTHQGVVSRRPVGGALLVSDTGMVVVVCVFGGPPWIRLVPTRPTDCRSDWDLGTLEVRSTPHALCPVPQSVLPPGSVVMRGVYLVTNNAWKAGACQVEST